MRNPLHAICPYFAMFPETFVEKHVSRFTKPGEWIFDPFGGRGTTVLQSLLMKRNAAAVDLNPVAICISRAKGIRPSLANVIRRIDLLSSEYGCIDSSNLRDQRDALPEFFGRAFHWRTLDELLFLREHLNWQRSAVDCFITALVLGSLHGEMDTSSSYFSNQMRRTISTKPQYSLKYWRSKNLWPKRRYVFDILKSRAILRLQSQEKFGYGVTIQSDARIAYRKFPKLKQNVKAVVTSPPYFDVTNYEEDQWLRLWFLGGLTHPTYGKISSDDRHSNWDSYWNFLKEAWAGIGPLMAPNATLVCRLGVRNGVTDDMITERFMESILQNFPEATMLVPPTKSQLRKRQTDAFRPGSSGCRYEIDYIVRLPRFQPV